MFLIDEITSYSMPCSFLFNFNFPNLFNSTNHTIFNPFEQIWIILSQIESTMVNYGMYCGYFEYILKNALNFVQSIHKLSLFSSLMGLPPDMVKLTLNLVLSKIAVQKQTFVHTRSPIIL